MNKGIGWRTNRIIGAVLTLTGFLGAACFCATAKPIRAGEPSNAQSPLPPDAIPALLDAIVPELMESYHVPGVSVVGIQNCRIAWDRQYGVRSADRPEKVERDTVFEACSMSKTPLAYVALKLVEQKKLDLDKLLYLLFDKPYLDDEPLHERITARMVLSHTTGFPNWREGGWEKGGPLPVQFEPGTRFGYSGEGFLYLQRGMERITGTPWEEYVRESLFKPLDIQISSYVWEDRYAELAAAGHDQDGKVKTPRSLFHQANAGYSLYCTPYEYAKFLLEIMKEDRSAGHSLNDESIRQMLIPVIEATGRKPIERPFASISDTVSWGLGWPIDKTVRGDRIYHGGSNGTGFRCFSEFDPQGGSGIVIMTNALRGEELWRRVIANVSQ